jgi:REP element-mobilizing transposase RayT
MPRPPRLEAPGAYHHVTARGNDRQSIFVDDADRRLFLALLDRAAVRYRWLCLAYCLMTNHFHLVVQTPEPNLGEGMRLLNGLYARVYNRQHGRIDHLFRNRYASRLIETDAHLIATFRYTVLNPVRAGVVIDPADWPWSSYGATLGLVSAPRFLAVRETLEFFAASPVTARRRFAEFVTDGIAQAPFALAMI